MKQSRIYLLMPFFIAIVLIFVGCASVPKEVVELSYTSGQDLQSLHSSYKALIQTYFNNLRAQTTLFLENRWVPVFLKDFIQKGQLVQMAQGSDPKRVFEDVQDWVEAAIMIIEAKKKELMDPINNDEKALLIAVDEAFSRTMRANATITAHLNSLRKVQEVQDEALKAMELKELRDQINRGLILSSDNAMDALEKLKKTEGLIDNADEKKNMLLKRVRGGSP